MPTPWPPPAPLRKTAITSNRKLATIMSRKLPGFSV
jgi:hypothetical protein